LFSFTLIFFAQNPTVARNASLFFTTFRALSPETLLISVLVAFREPAAIGS
jgi:hypothetical protein